MTDVTRILSAAGQGDRQAAAELLPLVYDELRRLAALSLSREKPGQTLQATALVHEAFLRLVDTPARSEGQEVLWDSRRHFFAAAAEAMRRILVENARRKKTLKRGGALARTEFDEALVLAPEPREDLEALDEALVALEAHDPVKARLVELRYFAGLTGAEAADLLGISDATADRHWAYARAWLRRRIAGPEAAADNPPADQNP